MRLCRKTLQNQFQSNGSLEEGDRLTLWPGTFQLVKRILPNKLFWLIYFCPFFWQCDPEEGIHNIWNEPWQLEWAQAETIAASGWRTNFLCNFPLNTSENRQHLNIVPHRDLVQLSKRPFFLFAKKYSRLLQMNLIVSKKGENQLAIVFVPNFPEEKQFFVLGCVLVPWGSPRTKMAAVDFRSKQHCEVNMFWSGSIEQKQQCLLVSASRVVICRHFNWISASSVQRSKLLAWEQQEIGFWFCVCFPFSCFTWTRWLA